MLLREIDPLAIAVPDVWAARHYYQRACGATGDHTATAASAGVLEALPKVAQRRRHAERPGSPARQPRHHRGVRAPEGQLRNPHRTRPGVMPRPSAVLWDMGGTLVDTEPYWMASERELVESFGHTWPEHHAH